MYKTLHKKQGSVTVQLRFARSSVTFCAKRDKKGNTELLDKVNGALETLKDNGTLDEIVAKYIKAE